MKPLAGLLCILLATTLVTAQLSDDYYKFSCPFAPAVVAEMVTGAVFLNPGLAPQLLRLHFHDCFVRGCDASVLIYKANHTAEMDGKPNKDSLKGFDFINEVKAVLELFCRRTVSCADVVALAARDAIVALGLIEGEFLKSYWDVPLGRKDGNFSFATEANNDLPAPSFNFTQLIAKFAAKGLSERQMVILSGAHTIGTSNCTNINNRLYNFTGHGDTDPSLNAAYVSYLKNECPKGIQVNRVAMKDQTGSIFSTNYTFDHDYYKNVEVNKGFFTSDAALITTSSGANLTGIYGNSDDQFTNDFNAAMVAMGAIGVSTVGHVRTNCSDPTS